MLNISFDKDQNLKIEQVGKSEIYKEKYAKGFMVEPVFYEIKRDFPPLISLRYFERENLKYVRYNDYITFDHYRSNEFKIVSEKEISSVQGIRIGDNDISVLFRDQSSIYESKVKI